MNSLLQLDAKHQAVVSQVRPVLDELIADGFRLSDDLYRLVLRRAREW